MMVAEFVARQQTSSPVNGETPTQNHMNSTMPSTTYHHQPHVQQHHIRESSSASPLFISTHDNQSTNGVAVLNTSNTNPTNNASIGPMSPRSSNSQDSCGGNYDLAASIKRKELFTQRKQREFIPDNKKDDSYWDRRRRNNEAAKRSREKRRFNDMVLEQRVVELTKENYVLKAQLEAIKDKYNICGENLVSIDQVMATFPSNEQVLSITKRIKLNSSGPSPLLYPQSPSPIPTSVIHQSNSSIESPPHQNHFSIGHANNNLYNNSKHESPLRELSPAVCYRDHIEQSPFIHNHHYAPYTSVHNLHQHHAQYLNAGDSVTNVLNLSRRTQSPFEVSSGSGSGVASGDDELCDARCEPVSDTNNSLPLKLRHKSHLGDKDAATTLLSLQHIKQEPGISRASPPWDGEGSSDERDSGISICTTQWTSLHNQNHRQFTHTDHQCVVQNKAIEGNVCNEHNVEHPTATITLTTKAELVGIENVTAHKSGENIHLKSKLAKLESEVESIKSMIIMNTKAVTQ